MHYNSKISSYNPQTDRLDAGRPLKHGLPVKPSAMSSDDHMMMTFLGNLHLKQVTMTNLHDSQEMVTMITLRVSTRSRVAMKKRREILKEIIVDS